MRWNVLTNQRNLNALAHSLKISCAGLSLLLFLGCTMTSGVVTDINSSSDGLIITKCDEIMYLPIGYIFIGEGNCHNETLAGELK